MPAQEQSPCPRKSVRASAEKQENPLLNLGFNVAVPILLLMKGDNWLPFLPAWGVLVLALAFPVGYFFYDLRQRGKRNFISIVGAVSVLLTGGIGLLKLPPEWIAIKEAAVPALLGLAVIISLKTKYPLVRTLLFNEQLIDVPKVEAALAEKDQRPAFEKVLRNCTALIALSFFLSAGLNFLVAKLIVTADPAVDEVLFNQQIGQMTGVGFVAIGLPATLVMMGALWYLLSQLRKLTGLSLEAIFPAMEEAAKEDGKQ